MKTIFILLSLFWAIPAWANPGAMLLMSVPTVASGGDCSVGNDQRDFSASGKTGDTGFMTEVTPTANCTISQMTFYVQDMSSGEGNVAIYNSDGTSKLAEGDLTTLTNDASNTVTLDSSYEVESGTTYQFVFGVKSTDTSYSVGFLNNQSGTNFWIQTSFDVEDTMPSTFSATSTNYNDDLYLFGESQ